MSGQQDNQVSRLFRNVFGGEGLQANVSGLARTFQEASKKGPQGDLMGCTWSGLSALYDSLSAGQEYCIKDRRFRVLKKLGEGGYAFVYLVREAGAGGSDGPQGSSPDESAGNYALKKFLIQTQEQLQLVKQEIQTASQFKHPSLLPLLDYAVVNAAETGTKEAYLLFPVYPEGTLQDHVLWLTEREPPLAHPERLTPFEVLHITRQVAAGLEHMHSRSPPCAHNDLKPGNVLLSTKPRRVPGGSQGGAGGISVAIMDFGSAAPARRQIRSRGDALNLQEWASQHCSAAYRAPELWDVPSNCDVDERTDVWSLGCTVFALMYGLSPFEVTLGEAGGSVQLAVMSGNIKWPPPARPPYPQALHDLVSWMVQTDPNKRPYVKAVIEKVDAMLAKLPPSM